MNEKMRAARKKRNRIGLLQIIFIAVFLKFTYANYIEFYDKINNRINQTKKEENLISLGSLIRNKEFYKDKSYAESYSFFKKEWNNQSVGGIVYNDQGDKPE